MNAEDVQNEVIGLLKSRFQIEQKSNPPDIIHCPLTAPPYSLDGVALTYLFFEIEKIYNIHISTANILNGYGFQTINGISDIVIQYLNET